MMEGHLTRALITIPAVSSALACVGSEDGGQVEERDTRQPGATSFGRDTVSPLTYLPVEIVVESEEPRKLTLHLIVPPAPTRQQKMATLRAALDSLSRADSTLAAARAILYAGQPNPEAVDFIATGWAEWVPPEGFEEAPPRSPGRPYRVYVFHNDPGWNDGSDAATEGRGDDDGRS